MLPLLLLAFIIVPIVELAVILQVGNYLGVLPTIALLIIDSVVGAVLVKREGKRAWDAFRDALSQTRWPGDEVMQGALILFGGALLLTPGFVTDVVGLLAVVPPTRALISRFVRRQLTPAPVREVFNLRDARRGTGGKGGDERAEGDPRGASVQRGDRGRDGDVYDVEVVSVERDETPGEAPGATSDDGPGTTSDEQRGEPSG